jgi:branched-chain amino acid transport system ATP-binding protein
MLRVENLHAGYGDLTIVRGASFEVVAGEIMAVLGHNGVGKSTLLRAIMGLRRPTAGTVTFGSRNLLGLKPHEIAAEGIAYVPQEAALFPDLSVVQNLRVAFGRRSGFDEACARALGPFPFLRERFYQRAGTLSGGEQKMLLTARALLVLPRLVLVDEVTEGVQPMQVERIGTALRDLNQRFGTAMIVVEQNVVFTLGLARRFIVMKQGVIALAGETAAPNARSLIDEQLAL